MSMKERIELLPYGSTKTGYDVGYDVCEKGDLFIYLRPFKDVDKSKVRKQIKKAFPELQSIEYLEDGQGAFWSIELGQKVLRLENNDKTKGDTSE